MPQSAPTPRRPTILLVLLLLVAGSLAAPLQAHPRRYAVPGHELPVALLPAGRATYLVTEHGVLRQQGRQFVRCYQSPAPISCALAADTVLWLGTRQGLVQLSPRTWQARPVALLPAPAGQSPVTALLRDAAGAVWAGVAGYGAYQQTAGGQWQAMLPVPTINAGLLMPDGAVWLGTDTGLHRWQRGEWTRYNEEGVANHEIADNIVERLLPDNAGNLWVVMADALSVFAPAGAPAEVPTVRYLGRPGNALYGVAHVPGRGHVFATALGLLLLPTQPTGALLSPESGTDQVETPQLLVPFALPATAAPRLLRVDARQRVWVVSADEVSVWGMKEFRAATLRPAARPAVGS